jgi:SMI1 / KNR4 family (SUKH-1)
MCPSPTSDDELLRALRQRATSLLDPDDPARAPYPLASPEALLRTESRLGFELPPLLRRVYEIANGGLGPGYGLLPISDGRDVDDGGDGEDTLVAVYRRFVDSKYAPKPGEPGFDQYPWPDRLLPICDWGDAIWSCLDCRSADGPVVTASNGKPFASTGHTLGSWLSAWLAGIDLFEEMFEPGPSRTAINPFTKKPIVIKTIGKPRGPRWP